MQNTTEAEPSGSTVRTMLLLLTCTAGVVDATAYLRFGRVFVANMTGNTVLLALRVAGADPGTVVGNFTALLGFCAGAALGAVMHREPRKPILQTLTPVLVVETIFMGIVALLWQFTGESYQLAQIGIAAVAMGLQAAVVSRIGLSGVSSVTITNTLTRAMAELVSRLRGPRTDPLRSQRVWFLAIDWFAYFVGALLAATGIRLGLDLPFVLAIILLTFSLLLAIRMRQPADAGNKQ